MYDFPIKINISTSIIYLLNLYLFSRDEQANICLFKRSKWNTLFMEICKQSPRHAKLINKVLLSYQLYF